MNRDLGVFLSSRFLSTLAIQMQSVAIGYQVFDATRDPLDLGFIGLAQFLPAAGLSLVAGDFADRFDRRRILLMVHLALALCSVLLCLIGSAAEPNVSLVYGVLVLFGAARAFGGPAGQALLPNLVPGERFSRAVAWNSSIWQIGTIAGPALGGVFYGFAGGPRVYATSALLSLSALLLVLSMRVPSGRMATGAGSLQRLLAGVRYVIGNKIILGALSLDLFAVLLGGAVALLPIFARDILVVGPQGMGLLRSAPAAGAAVMALILAWRPLGGRVGLKMMACVTVFGIATIVFGASKYFPLSLAALVVLGAADMVSVVTRQTLVQITTPPEMRGRVSAVNLVFIGASNELGEFESGVTARWLGTVPAVIVGGCGTLGVVTLWSFFFPALRRVDRIEPVLPATASAHSEIQPGS